MQKLQCILNVNFKDKRMAVLKPVIILSSKMPTFIIKSTTGMVRFNLSTIISIALLSVFLSVSVVYSSPPALPPPLPKAKDIDQSDKTPVDDPDALLKGINQFMDSRESDTENPTKPHSNSTNQADSFIDFNNDKLPSLEGDNPDTKSNIETPNLSTDLPKQQESAPTNIVDTQKIQPAKIPEPAVPSTQLPSLPTPSSGNIVPPEVTPPGSIAPSEVKTPDNIVPPEVTTPNNIVPSTTPDNIVLPEVKAPDNIHNPKIQEQNSVKDDVLLPTKESTINKKPIDEIVIPNLDIPLQENKKPSFTPVVPHVDITKPESSAPVDLGNTETKTPVETTLPKVLDTDKIKQTKEDQLKPATSTPIPVFVQEPTPVEPIKKDTTSKEPEKNKNVQEEKITPNELQKKINTPNSKKDLNVIDKNNPVAPSSIPSPEVVKFAKDETQMVLLPNDDVVLGVLTDDARLEQMDMYKFIKIAKQSYDRKKQVAKRHLIENFINSYYNTLRPVKPIAPENLMDITFESVKKNNLFALRTFVDNYQVLQRRGENNYTLLHEAAESGNYYIAKFLIIRGININAVDYQHRTALDIAKEENNNVSCVIKKTIGR